MANNYIAYDSVSGEKVFVLENISNDTDYPSFEAMQADSLHTKFILNEVENTTIVITPNCCITPILPQ